MSFTGELKQRPLHLYRHLLREASYLPPVCRERIEPRIRLLFRRNRREPEPTRRLRGALHGLRNLRAANVGDIDRMRRVLMLTFGRIGWRRHELLAELHRAEQPDNSAQLEAQLKETPAGTTRDWLDSWDKEALLTLAKSQAGRNLRSSPRPHPVLKKLDPRKAVPPINVWGKPFSEKPARAKEKKWWKQVENRILPPLPRSEWDLLKQLATGQAGPQWAVPPRRASAAAARLAAPSASEATGIEAWEWEKYATAPIRVVERPNARRFRLPSQPGAPPPPGSPFDGPAIGFHNYTPRTWRRLYGEVWRLSSVVEKTPGRPASSWTITWGGTHWRPLAPSAADLEFFEGVDRNGALLAQPAEQGAEPREADS